MNTRFRQLVCCGCAFWLGSLTIAVATRAAEPAKWTLETAAQREARMAWWREARFGMFIHWGLYAVPAGRWNGQPVPSASEWIMNTANIPIAEYEPLAKEFNPTGYDPEQWAQIAQQAGVKYIVITSKHHDGFCLFDTAATNYDAVDATPYGKDLLKPLAAACRKRGIRFCVYYSIMDWHHPAQTRGSERAYNPTKIMPGRKAQYMDYMKQHFRELLACCDPEVLWFDGEWCDWYTEEDARDIYGYLRELKLSLIINNRVGKGRQGMQGLTQGEHIGDFGTPEQQIPATGLAGVDWESCMTMNGSWGYKRDDQNWKSDETLIRNLVDIASKGGNYLLNVGPTAEGLIPPPSVERLEAMGRWLRVNGESIYGTQASPFKRLGWGRCTQRPSADGTVLYAHVFHWPADGRLRLAGLQNKVAAAYLLADPEKKPLGVEATAAGVTVSLPGAAVDPVCSVVVIKIAGAPRVEPVAIGPQADGAIVLTAAEAEYHGSHVRYETGAQRDNVGFWTDPAEWVEWNVNFARAGTFTVSAELAAIGGGSFQIVVGAQSLTAKAPVSGDYGRFQKVELGRLSLASGVARVAVRPIADGWQPVNLRALKFSPE